LDTDTGIDGRGRMEADIRKYVAPTKEPLGPPEAGRGKGGSFSIGLALSTFLFQTSSL